MGIGLLDPCTPPHPQSCQLPTLPHSRMLPCCLLLAHLCPSRPLNWHQPLCYLASLFSLSILSYTFNVIEHEWCLRSLWRLISFNTDLSKLPDEANPRSKGNQSQMISARLDTHDMPFFWSAVLSRDQRPISHKHLFSFDREKLTQEYFI